MAYPTEFYNDPSNAVEAARRLESRARWEADHTSDTCRVCENVVEAWGEEACGIKKRRLENGFCFYMRKRLDK